MNHPPQASSAQTPRSPDPEVLDAAALAKLRQLDPSGRGRLLQRVLSSYSVSLSRLRQQIGDAQALSDSAGLWMGVHTLKSSSASIGAFGLSQQCAAAEQAIREGLLEGLPERFAQLQCEIDRVDEAVCCLIAKEARQCS